MTNIRIYKGVFNEEDRVKYLEIFKQMPDTIWTQSDCTDEEVVQLKDFMPFIIKFKLMEMHYNMMSLISKDFELDSKGIVLTHDGSHQANARNTLTIDKRIVGNSLGPHADIPTGTFEKEKGVFFEDGSSPIAMSCVFYWNDDFEGGELKLYSHIDRKDLIQNKHLYDFDKIEPAHTYKPVAGDFVVFPSETVHSISPITSGTRYSTQYFYNRLSSDGKRWSENNK
jgi:hypothetical protein